MINIHYPSQHYFAAANTHKGFESLFEEIFNRKSTDTLYILKGGPGVGKSTFMKKAAAVFESCGDSVAYYHCSSDPDSLDGIAVEKKKIAIVDGTSPHAVEASLAGAYEQIIDLGGAWDVKGLSLLADELFAITKEKSDCYKAAYQNLEACKKLCCILSSFYEGCVLWEKLEKSGTRLGKSIIPEGDEFKRKNVLVNAASCKGKVHLCTFEDMADYCVFIKEPYYQCGTADAFFKHLIKEAQKKKAEVIVSLSPFDTSIIDGLYFPKSGVSVTNYSAELVADCDRQYKKCKIINTARFIDVHLAAMSRKERRYYEKSIKALEERALKQLEKAGALHALLEEKYSRFTDYSIVEDITDKYLKKFS